MDDRSGSGLPASIEAAWGLRERPSRGPRPSLSLRRIVDAAIEVADADGLAALSMSRVAAHMGASTMALYRYVDAKDELLDLMVDSAYGPPPAAAPAPEEGWREGLSRWAWTELAAFRRHPWVLRVPISGPPTTPNATAWLERGLACLRSTGLAENQKLSVILLLTGFVRNYATMTADLATSFLASGTAQEAMSAYGKLLARLADPQHHPALHAAISAGAFDEPDEPDDEFVFGLERILDGVDALVRART